MTAAAELSKQDLERVRECEQAIGYVFKGPTLLLHALTHASSQNADLPSNERLEFLGDSVLGLAVSEFLFNFLEDGDEGDLTQIKSVVVSTVTLAGRSARRSRRRLAVTTTSWRGSGACAVDGDAAATRDGLGRATATDAAATKRTTMLDMTCSLRRY